MKYLLLAWFISCSCTLVAQTDVVSEEASYPGGEKAMFNFIAENIQYPDNVLKNELSGISIIACNIDSEGNLSDIKVARGFDLSCDNEALRLVKSMPKWHPKISNGNPIETSLYIPVLFKQEDANFNEQGEMIVELVPSYPGGNEAMFQFINENVKYPLFAKEKNITGRVVIGFVIEKDGSLTNINIKRDIGGSCGE